MAPAESEDRRVKFDAYARDVYLDSLRHGNLKGESARMAEVSYRTVERRRRDDDDFAEDEKYAMMEAREGVEKVLYEMALDHDLGAIKLWLRAHDRSTYGDKTVIELDATPNALALSQNDALAKVAELQITLAQRRISLELDDGIIDVDSEDLG